MDVLFQLTDDQIALLGCMGAIAVSMLLMSLSYHANPANKAATEEERLQSIPLRTKQSSERKAA